MSTKQDLTVHEGENWKITFAAHYPDSTTMPLGSGTEIDFRVSDSAGLVRLEKSEGFGITVTNEVGGVAEIAVSVDDQDHNEINASTACFYEIKVVKDLISYVQAEGRLIVGRSLFSSVALDPLLLQFRVRCPEFTEDDAVVSLFLRDAASVVDQASPPLSDADRDLAVIYYAAHMLQLRVSAKTQYEAGGLQTGPVTMIRVEDRTTTYGDMSALLSKGSMTETYYGDRYLKIRRRYPTFLLRV